MMCSVLLLLGRLLDASHRSVLMLVRSCPPFHVNQSRTEALLADVAAIALPKLSGKELVVQVCNYFFEGAREGGRGVLFCVSVDQWGVDIRFRKSLVIAHL